MLESLPPADARACVCARCACACCFAVCLCRVLSACVCSPAGLQMYCPLRLDAHAVTGGLVVGARITTYSWCCSRI